MTCSLDFDEGDAVPHFDGASEQAPGLRNEQSGISRDNRWIMGM